MTAVAAQGVGTRRMGREEVVRLGQSGRPWEFVPIAAQVMRIAPGDAGVRLLLAANLAKLGLRTAALEELGRLPDEARGDATVRALQGAVAGLPGDRISAEDVARVCRANVEALGERAGTLGGELGRWAECASEREWFRAGGGNVVRRSVGGGWELWGDHRAAAERFATEHLKSGAGVNASVLTIEGMDPPWLFLEVVNATPRRKDGAWTRLQIVQADAMEFLDGLACADLRSALSPERARVFVGERAGERLRDELRGRYAYSISSAYIPQLNTRRRIEPGVDRILSAAEEEQCREQERLLREVGDLYAGRDREWWARRYRDAAEGGPALRVLVPTCRFSTYIRHSSADLVEALKAAGCDAELLIEPDDSTHFSATAYLRRLADFKPDLVVLINYTRGQLGEFFPKELPFVTWIQDALAQQMDPRVGERLGGFDFLVGHLRSELFTVFKYPRERTLHAPVVSSTRKFHPGPVSRELKNRFDCDVAMVSHHSEPPEAMHSRLMDEAGGDPTTRQIISRLYPEVVAAARDPMAGPVYVRLESATRAAARDVVGRGVENAPVVQIMRQYCMPLADRVIRHQTLDWAASVCARRGWRLRVYGRGWESHPTLATFAGGEVDHGEELRACYQCARVHLHASINTIVHQRVMECALSGGLPLCRLTREVIGEMWAAGRRAVVLRGGDSVKDDKGRVSYPIADHPEMMMLASQAGALGITCDAHVAVLERTIPELKREDTPAATGVNAAWLLLDLAAMTFRSEEELERGVERAVQRPEWRSAMSEAMARRVRARVSHDALVREVLSLVRRGLGGARKEGHA